MELIIREVKPQEVLDTARIYIDCWQRDYREVVPEEMLNNMSLEQEAEECSQWLYGNEDLTLLYVAMDDSKMAGYIAASPNTEHPLEYEMEINGLFVERQYRGRGIGLRLMNYMMKELAKRGFAKVLLYNFKDTKSNGFYKSLGGRVVSQQIQRPGGREAVVDIFGWDVAELQNTLGEKLKNYGL